MKLNAETRLCGKVVELLPYRAEHVPTYHGWMEDAWLREMTASDRLTLEEEFAMCTSWREDDDKCTFILAARADDAAAQPLRGDHPTPEPELEPEPEPEAEAEAAAELDLGGDAPDSRTSAGAGSAAIIGDVNLFFHEYLLEEGEAKFSVAEIEVMVAVTAARRRGHATEAVLLMMHYGVVEIGVRTFIAKIKICNLPSIQLFKKLGYVETRRDEDFEEVELRCTVSAEELKERMAKINAQLPADPVASNGVTKSTSSVRVHAT